MLIVFGAFFIFQDEFSRLMIDAPRNITAVMDVLVLAEALEWDAGGCIVAFDTPRRWSDGSFER